MDVRSNTLFSYLPIWLRYINSQEISLAEQAIRTIKNFKIKIALDPAILGVLHGILIFLSMPVFQAIVRILGESNVSVYF